MNQAEVTSLLVLIGLVLTSAEGSDMGEVEISGTTVTMKCPFNNTVKWHKEKKELTDEMASEQNYEMKKFSSSNEGWYHCTGNNKEFHFFIKAKVCDNCYDLHSGLAAGLMVGDILITLGVILIVYLCARRNAGPAPPQRAVHTRQANPSAPPPPNPDYEPLSQATRSKDVYAEARRKY